jgi:sugar phosphate isomerase/epimerase
MDTSAPIGRRHVLASLALAVSGRLTAAPERRMGLALYTVRKELAARPAEVLKLAAAIGYSEVEILRNQIAPVVPLLEQNRLRAVSVRFETPLITGNWQAWKDAEMPPVDERLTFEHVIDQAGAHGIRTLVFNYLPPKERGELDYYRGLADKLNAAADKCRRAGMKLWYHNHNFEFAAKTGGRPIEVLLSRLDLELVALEVDTFWVGMAGQDPAEFIRQNAGRVAAVHLKDRARNSARPRFDISSVPLSAYQEIGAGEMDISAILGAATRAGVAHYFVEQDHGPDPLGAIRRSYDALRKLGF